MNLFKRNSTPRFGHHSTKYSHTVRRLRVFINALLPLHMFEITCAWRGTESRKFCPYIYRNFVCTFTEPNAIYRTQQTHCNCK